jgi:hypothetical protein
MVREHPTQTSLPGEDLKPASAAIHYASVFHTKWLWHRVGDPKWWK